MIFHVHCLPSFAILMKWIASLGVPGRNIFLIQKPYSTIVSVLGDVAKMGWHIIDGNVNMRLGQYDICGNFLLDKGVRVAARTIRLASSGRPRVLLIDDGGMLTAAWCRNVRMRQITVDADVVSIQQTRSGFYACRQKMTRDIVKVDVGRSAAKRYFESKYIADSIINKVDSLGILSGNIQVGVVGVGAIGAQLVSQLVRRGINVSVFDREFNKREISDARFCSSAGECVAFSDVVFGCVGRNWMATVSPEKRDGVTHLISCSSRDVEFQSILLNRRARSAMEDKPFAPIFVRDRNEYVVHNWGFPINFDRQREWEPAEHIILTRALLYAAIVQAMYLNVELQGGVVILSPYIQRRIVSHWLEACGTSSQNFGVSLPEMRDMNWWGRNSGIC